MTSEDLIFLFSVGLGSVQELYDKSFLATCYKEHCTDLLKKGSIVISPAFKGSLFSLFASLRRPAQQQHIIKCAVLCTLAHFAAAVGC